MPVREDEISELKPISKEKIAEVLSNQTRINMLSDNFLRHFLLSKSDVINNSSSLVFYSSPIRKASINADCGTSTLPN